MLRASILGSVSRFGGEDPRGSYSAGWQEPPAAAGFARTRGREDSSARSQFR